MAAKDYRLGRALLVAMCVCLPVLLGAQAANASGSVSKQDQQFINKAWNSNTTEVRLGEVAETKASNADVKAFGRRMVTEGTALNQELSTLARAHGATLPRKLNAHPRHLIDRLSRLNGSTFDKQYMNVTIKRHKAAVAAFRKESKDKAQTPVDQWAGRAVATLKENLQLAEKTGKEVGASGANRQATGTAWNR